MIVVLDNTVLSNFAQSQISSVIFMLWGDQVCTTPDVISEYHAGIKSAGLPASSWKSLQIQKLSSAEIEFADSLSAKLGKGECSCLAIAHSRNAILATDDLFARRVADRYHIQKIGTVGILIQCVKQKILSVPKAQKALNVMMNYGYRSPITDLQSFFLDHT